MTPISTQSIIHKLIELYLSKPTKTLLRLGAPGLLHVHVMNYFMENLSNSFPVSFLILVILLSLTTGIISIQHQLLADESDLDLTILNSIRYLFWHGLILVFIPLILMFTGGIVNFSLIMGILDATFLAPRVKLGIALLLSAVYAGLMIMLNGRLALNLPNILQTDHRSVKDVWKLSAGNGIRIGVTMIAAVLPATLFWLLLIWLELSNPEISQVFFVLAIIPLIGSLLLIHKELTGKSDIPQIERIGKRETNL